MAGRPKYHTDEELIDSATEVFWQKGYEGASAKDLMKEMKIGQGSFYRSFPGGKRELYQKSLERRIKKSISHFYKGLKTSQDPVQFIKDFFYAIPQRTSLQKDCGCYLGNAIIESSNVDEETKILSTNLLEQLKDGFEKALEKAQTMGQLDSKKSPTAIALFLINFWNGINVTQRMYPDRATIEQLIKTNLQILD